MRFLISFVLLLMAAWAGYWFVGSSAKEAAMRAWITDRQNAGWVANYDSLETQGFPSRFDTTVMGLDLADPATGVAWSVPRLDILQLSYTPNHIIALLPGAQTLATPKQKITIRSSDLRGSVVFDPDTDLTLNRATFELADVVLASSLDWTARLTSGQFATRQANGDPLTHDIAFEARDFAPSEGLRDRLDPTGTLPAAFSAFTADLTMGFTAPWDRHAIEEARPQIETLDIRLIQATWGQLDLKVAGTLQVDATGIPTGKVTVKAVNWPEMLEIARASGAIPEDFIPTLTRALEFAAGLSGDPRTLDAPLTFRGGVISFGPIPLGPAPRLVIR